MYEDKPAFTRPKSIISGCKPAMERLACPSQMRKRLKSSDLYLKFPDPCKQGDCIHAANLITNHAYLCLALVRISLHTAKNHEKLNYLVSRAAIHVCGKTRYKQIHIGYFENKNLIHLPVQCNIRLTHAACTPKRKKPQDYCRASRADASRNPSAVSKTCASPLARSTRSATSLNAPSPPLLAST